MPRILSRNLFHVWHDRTMNKIWIAMRRTPHSVLVYYLVFIDFIRGQSFATFLTLMKRLISCNEYLISEIYEEQLKPNKC